MGAEGGGRGGGGEGAWWVGGLGGVLPSMEKMRRNERDEKQFLILHWFYKQGHHFGMKWGCQLVDITFVL